MSRTSLSLGFLLVTLLTLAANHVGAADQRPSGSDGWLLPPTAADEANPLAPTPSLVAKGKDLYKAKCQRCHGVTGKGDGPDADADHPPGNLTDSSRALRNPDGVMFYKVWNGRAKPKMPTFKTDLSREEVWTVILYAKTLRR